MKDASPPCFPLGIIAGETKPNEELTSVTFTLIITKMLLLFFFTKQFGNQVHPKNIWTGYSRGLFLSLSDYTIASRESWLAFARVCERLRGMCWSYDETSFSSSSKKKNPQLIFKQ